jgi:hypothetical protein
MNFSGISPEQGPKISIPLRFYFLAHLNMIFFIIFLLSKLYLDNSFIKLLDLELHIGIILFHSITMGFLLFIIVGSLFQMFPVVLGILIKQNNFLANSIIILLYLIYFFLYNYFTYFQNAYYLGILILLLVLIFIYYFFYPLVRVIKNKDNIGFLFSIFSFIIGLIIILFYFINVYVSFVDVDLIVLRKIHGIIMLIGFVQQLIISVSFQIIPMFYITKNYPKIVRYIVNYGIFLLILLSILFYSYLSFFVYIYIGLNILYIYYTIKLIFNRNRKIRDTTLKFFELGLFFLFITNISILFETVRTNFFYVIIFLYLGFVISFIYGMLYKIIPFLCWFHLQSIKNRNILESLKDKSKMLSIRFNMSDFILRKLEEFHFLLFIIIILFLVFFNQLYFVNVMIILLFFILFFIQISYAIYKFLKILKTIQINK